MQFKVPQDVQQADKIVSFLTLPQLIICVVGFGLAYGVYTVLVKQGLVWVFWFPPVFIIAALTAAFAFMRIANLPFHRYLALVIERFVTPSKRVWVKGTDRIMTSEESLVTSEEKKAQEKAKATSAFQVEKEEKLQKIGEITDILDTLKKEPENVEPLEAIDKTPDDDLLSKAFLDEPLHQTEPVKTTVVTPEDKIMAISSGPKPEPVVAPLPKPVPPPAPIPVAPKPITVAAPLPVIPKPAPVPVSAPAPAPIPQTLQHPQAPSPNPLKKKRRRRRKKKTGEQAGTIPHAPSPTPPLPDWLKQKPEVKPQGPQQQVIKKPEPLLAPPAPEPILPAPEVEPILEAPKPEPILQAPKPEPVVPAAVINPTPAPSIEPDNKAKIGDTISAEDLKKGKTITFS